MIPVIIGLDTSCYTTSAAAVTVEGEILCSSRKLLPVPEGHRGLRQSEMVFIHTKQLPERIAEVAACLHDHQIVGVCASARPRDELDSYMPAFHVGDAQARSLSALLGVPYFASTHQRGHVMAAAVDSGIGEGAMLAVHLSGGTTELLALDEQDQLTLLGGTLDLHAGQVVDRTGVAMGLPFPAGPHLETLARKGSASSLLPANMANGDLDCHLSGAESQIQRWIREGNKNREDIAMEVYDLLARTVSRMILAGSAKTGIRQVLVAGGVASSPLFREELRKRIAKKDRDMKVCFGRPEFSGDNAVGAALIGAKQYRQMKQNDMEETSDGSTDS